MSRTFKHTLNGKIKNGIINLSNVPMVMFLYWNRQNFWTGKYRSERKEYFSKEKEKEINEYRQT